MAAWHSLASLSLCGGPCLASAGPRLTSSSSQLELSPPLGTARGTTGSPAYRRRRHSKNRRPPGVEKSTFSNDGDYDTMGLGRARKTFWTWRRTREMLQGLGRTGQTMMA